MTQTSFSKPILAAFFLLLVLSCGTPPEQANAVLQKNVVFRWNPAAYTGTDYTQYVDPMIGTAAHGHTFPGATAPFGMVQLSPDTRVDGSWDGCSGYHYSDSLIYGFSHTHLSGTGCSDYGDILFMPATGAVQFNNGADGKPGYRSAYTHADEKAEAGYYKIKLQNGVTAELTASPRTGIHRYTFPGNEGHVLIDLKHRDEVIESQLHFNERNAISGYRVSKAWATEQRIYFWAEFSEQIDSVLLRDTTHLEAIAEPGKSSSVSKDVRAALKFANLKNPLTVKVGISAVSEEAARANMLTEAGSRSFDDVRKAVRDDWNNELSRIAIKSNEDNKQLRTFYTALYHCFTAPNVYCDVDGSYRGRDQQVHKDSLHQQYTVFSLWDTYRALNPLFTIVQQNRTNDFIRTFLKQYKEGGRLPVWELSGNETDCMIGYHAVPVIADAYMKGIRDYDAELAFTAMLHSATEDRRGLKAYKQCGYIPAEGEPESVSKTLEYAYDDWCIAQVAKALNHDREYKVYSKRAQAWKNMYDPKTGFMRARLNNAFVEPFAPEEVNFHFTEANAWQYSLALPHDISTLITRMGGPEKFEKHLDNLFTTSSKTSGREQADITGLIGQYAQGNEPSHHMAYLYAYCGKPWKTEARVHEILTTLYKDTPDGLCGNEDCGQMSAWYVMSALGFYSVTPGTTDYVCGMPLFDSVDVHLENGKTLQISKRNSKTPEPFVNAVMLQDKTMESGLLDHAALMQGGKLVYQLESRLRESKVPGAPRNFLTPEIRVDETMAIVPVPRATQASRTFEKSMQLAFAEPELFDGIFYAINNGPYVEWKGPVKLEQTSSIRAYARKGNEKSDVAEFTYFRAQNDRKIKLLTTYANQYAAGGEKALIDFIRGPDNFMTGMWQGYEGVNLEAVIDLNSTQALKKCSIGFLQDENAWIFMPAEVEFLASQDGKNFKSIGVVKNDIPDKQSGVVRKDFTLQQPVQARYIKVIGKNNGVCPEWHKGAGNKAWIFADEIIIE